MLHKKSLLFVALSILTAYPTFARSEEVRLEIDNVHIPKGWDSNDQDVQVVVTGELPSTCYRRPHGEAKVIDNQVYIDVSATKIDEKDTFCIMALVPYTVSVPLGRLNEGTYRVAVNPGSDQEKASVLSVEHPNSNSIDNFTYANVTNLKRKGTTNTYTLEGVHPSSCMSIERVEIISNLSQDTFSILPIVKQVEPVCDRMIQPFTYDFELPAVEKSEIVVHVRKIDGTGSNYTFKNSSK